MLPGVNKSVMLVARPPARLSCLKAVERAAHGGEGEQRREATCRHFVGASQPVLEEILEAILRLFLLDLKSISMGPRF